VAAVRGGVGEVSPLTLELPLLAQERMVAGGPPRQDRSVTPVACKPRSAGEGVRHFVRKVVVSPPLVGDNGDNKGGRSRVLIKVNRVGARVAQHGQRPGQRQNSG
jgi:hypothetical protein